MSTACTQSTPRSTFSPGRMDELADQPWGMREFNVWDPHGNLLRIGQIVDG